MGKILILDKRNLTYAKSNKFFPTQRELKGLYTQVHSSRLNLSTYIHAGEAELQTTPWMVEIERLRRQSRE